MKPRHKPALPVVHLEREEIDGRIGKWDNHEASHAFQCPGCLLDKRRKNFAEVEGGYDDKSAQLEAARCLACGICSECMSCTFACGVNAIDHDMVAREETIQVGAVILAPGYQIYRSELSEEYGYGRYPNVITSLQFERMLSASGPTHGHVQRPSDGKRRSASLSCNVSAAATKAMIIVRPFAACTPPKKPIIAKEHHPDLDIHVFFMDMRAYSKGYWQLFRTRARPLWDSVHTLPAKQPVPGSG